MSQIYGRIVVHINEETHPLWTSVKREAKRRGLPYSRVMEQAARLWLEEACTPPDRRLAPSRAERERMAAEYAGQTAEAPDGAQEAPDGAQEAPDGAQEAPDEWHGYAPTKNPFA
jgi:hypothetical protein